MTKEQIIGIVIIAVCCWGCAGFFSLLALRAGKRKRPVRFWPGIPVAPKEITNALAYNRAVAKLWWLYSVPFWLSGGCCIIGILIYNPWLEIACCVILLLSATFGTWLLIRTYKQIYTRFSVKKRKKKE